MWLVCCYCYEQTPVVGWVESTSMFLPVLKVCKLAELTNWGTGNASNSSGSCLITHVVLFFSTILSISSQQIPWGLVGIKSQQLHSHVCWIYKLIQICSLYNWASSFKHLIFLSSEGIRSSSSSNLLMSLSSWVRQPWTVPRCLLALAIVSAMVWLVQSVQLIWMQSLARYYPVWSTNVTARIVFPL